MASGIGSSLVKIQDDLCKLRQAINNGTHSDGTPIDIHVIEVRNVTRSGCVPLQECCVRFYETLIDAISLLLECS